MSFFYAGTLWGELRKYLKKIMEWFVEACGRRYLNVSSDKGKVMVLVGKEILVC